VIPTGEGATTTPLTKPASVRPGPSGGPLPVDRSGGSASDRPTGTVATETTRCPDSRPAQRTYSHLCPAVEGGRRVSP
jgi:hypothetical protein